MRVALRLCVLTRARACGTDNPAPPVPYSPAEICPQSLPAFNTCPVISYPVAFSSRSRCPPPPQYKLMHFVSPGVRKQYKLMVRLLL